MYRLGAHQTGRRTMACLLDRPGGRVEFDLLPDFLAVFAGVAGNRIRGAGPFVWLRTAAPRRRRRHSEALRQPPAAEVGESTL